MTTLSTYLQISNNLTKWRSLTEKSTDVAKQTKYFTDNIGKITSGKDLVKNTKLFNYALTAFGLGDQLQYKALFTKVLDQGVTNKKALANTLNNPKILAFAKAFDFAGKGAGVTSAAGFAKGVTDQFVEQSLESTQGRQNPGVELALYFARKAPTITSVYSILADKKLLTVVQNALGLSPLTSGEPIDQQKALLSGKVNLKDFQDPKKLQSFISRFAALYDYNNAGGDGGGGAATFGANAPNALLFDGSAGISTDTLLLIQSAKNS